MPNGSKYVGEMRNTSFHGHGVLTMENGISYTGDFFKGKKHGQGKETFKDGTRFEGRYFGDLQHGQGTLFMNDKTTITGHFCQGKMNGVFIKRDSKGVEYEREYLNGKSVAKTWTKVKRK